MTSRPTSNNQTTSPHAICCPLPTGQKNARLLFILSLFLMVAVILLLMSNRKFMTIADDIVFPQQLKRFHGMGEYLLHRYNTWSGRLPIDFLLPLILDANIWVWRVANSLMLFCLLLCSFKIASFSAPSTRSEHGSFLLWFLFFIFFLMKTDVMVWGALWATGSLNYLWATSLFLVAMLPFLGLLQQNNKPVSLWIISMLCSLYAGFQEQTSLLLLIFAMLIQLIVYCRTKTLPGWAVALTCVFAVNFGILLLAPGNSIRFATEANKFYPGFFSMPLCSKAILGYNYTLHNHFFYESVKQFMFLPFLTFFLTIRKSSPLAIRLTALYSCIFTIICILCARGLGGEFALIMNLDMYDSIEESTKLQLADLNIPVMVSSILALAAIPISWIYLFRDLNFHITLQLFFFGALLSSLALSASPTIYASGYRVFFVPDVLLTITALLLLNASMQELWLMKKTYLLVVILIVVSASMANIFTIYNRILN